MAEGTLPPWEPSEAARIGGAAAVGVYHDAPPWDAGAHCAGGLLPGTRALGEAMRRRFPGLVTGVGGYSCRQNTADSSRMSNHGAGTALDLSITPNGAVSDAGDEVANWLLEHARALGLEEVIWRRTMWSSQRGVHAYDSPGTDPHTSHVHIALSPTAARSFGGMPAETATGGTTGAVIGGAVFGAALLAAWRWWR